MTLSDADRIARGRFFALQLMRLGGIVLMFLGVAIWRSDLLRTGGLPIVGIPLMAAGLIEAVVLPRFVASKWRSPQDK